LLGRKIYLSSYAPGVGRYGNQKMLNLLREIHMSKVLSLSGRTWMTIWGIAIAVTLIGGTWRMPTSQTPSWKFNIQLPGSVVVLYIGWFIGPFQTIMSPAIVCMLTILINVVVYYVLVRIILFFAGKLIGVAARD
jgi:hypothetical protein